MSKIAVIGICGNSVFMEVDRFPCGGETLSAKSMYSEMGGKGMNQAIAAARMGAEVSFLAAVGDDEAAKECARVLRKENIHAHLQIKKEKQTTTAYIVTDCNGENCVTVYCDAELTEEDVFGFETAIAESDFLLLQQEVPAKVNKAAIRLAVKHGVRVILNPAPIRKIDDEDLALVWLVTPNEGEKRALHGLQVRNCITTLGRLGCCINGAHHIPARSVKAVDTTGAGDTFNGVLAVCLAEGMDLIEAAEYAVAASGLSVTRPHVLQAIPTRQEIERMIKNE